MNRLLSVVENIILEGYEIAVLNNKSKLNPSGLNEKKTNSDNIENLHESSESLDIIKDHVSKAKTKQTSRTDNKITDSKIRKNKKHIKSLCSRI